MNRVMNRKNYVYYDTNLVIFGISWDISWIYPKITKIISCGIIWDNG